MQSELPFVKMEATGNGLILIDARRLPRRNWSALARSMCDHDRGIGSDGLLVVLPSKTSDARMRMFNPDGTEDFCGNGIRCVGVFLYNQGGICKEHLMLETLAGQKTLRVEVRRGRATGVEVNMGGPVFEPRLLPARTHRNPIVDYPLQAAGRRVRVTCLSMGTPHAIIFVRKLPDDPSFLRVSRALERHRLFPERTSVIWAVVETRQRLSIRIWERGVGETLGCGTGACSTLVAARLKGLCDEAASVVSRGGSLRIHWNGDVFMTGSARKVFEGRWSI